MSWYKSHATKPTYEIRIYMGGPIEVAKQTLRKYCVNGGLCATINPTHFIYAGGEEEGFEIGIRQYPKYPETEEKLLERAQQLTHWLIGDTHQHSAMIVTPTETLWYSVRAGVNPA